MKAPKTERALLVGVPRVVAASGEGRAETRKGETGTSFRGQDEFLRSILYGKWKL